MPESPTRDSSVRWFRPGLLASGVLLLAVGMVLGFLLEQPKPTPGFDLSMLRSFESARTGTTVMVSRWIELWDGPIMTPWLLLAAAVLVALRGHRMMGILVALMTGLTWLPGHFAKSMFPRERPPASVNPVLHVTGANSFPSGHTGFAAAVLVTGLFVINDRVRAGAIKASWRRVWLVVGLLWVVIVGCSRMLLAVHYPTDVLGGALLAAGAALVLWPLAEWALVVVPRHVHALRDTRDEQRMSR